MEFPVENLDMSAHLTHRNQTNPLKRDDYCYDLLGVSNHYGNMMGGHYTSYCRSSIDGEWREFNDNKVRILEGPVATKEAYLLFYQRRSLSKEINQRLFTGDHWVFSLSFAPSEMVEEKSSTSETWGNNETNNQPRRSRSRSASPSAHRETNKDVASFTNRRIPTRPLTPQPFRRPTLTFTDDRNDDDDEDDDSSDITSPPSSPEKSNLTRRSRPVQRQASAPGPQFRREKSAGAPLTVKLRDSSRTLYNRRGVDTDQKDFMTDQNKKILKPEISNGVSRSQSQSAAKTDRPPLTQPIVIRHDPPKAPASDLPLTTSKTISHQAYLTNLDSDAKYPSSSGDYNRYLDNKKGTKSIHTFEPASILHVKYDSKDSYPSHTLKSYHDTHSDADGARKKLVQLIKPDSMNRAYTERAVGSIDSVDANCGFVRNGSRMYDKQKSSDLARYHLDHYLDEEVPETTTNTHSHQLDHLCSDIRGRDNEFKRDRWYNSSSHFANRRAGYARLEEVEDYFVPLDEPTDFPYFRTKVPEEAFRRLADKHFGEADRLREYTTDNYLSRITDGGEFQTSGQFSLCSLCLS